MVHSLAEPSSLFIHNSQTLIRAFLCACVSPLSRPTNPNFFFKNKTLDCVSRWSATLPSKQERFFLNKSQINKKQIFLFQLIKTVLIKQYTWPNFSLPWPIVCRILHVMGLASYAFNYQYNLQPDKEYGFISNLNIYCVRSYRPISILAMNLN